MYLASGTARFELNDASGADAKVSAVAKMGHWPTSVDPGDVESVSWKYEGMIDSHSQWYRINLTSDAAISWIDSVHEHQESANRTSQNDVVEGVRRTIAGPPPLHQQTGETPKWWAPPAIEFRATEVMLWSEGSGSVRGNATYSAFDPSTGWLWIYEYGAQHDLLWTKGDVPPGDAFSNTTESPPAE